MANENSIIYGPISLQADIYDVLQVSKNGTYYDLGWVSKNGHGAINKWARYKPVCLPIPNTPDTFDNTTHVWAETKLTTAMGYNWAWNRPWFCGCNYMPCYSVPVISTLADMGSGGEINNDALWVYNPYEVDNGFYARMFDFLGYNHYAQRPVEVSMSSSITLNGEFLASISAQGTSKDNGEIEFTDLAEFINPGTTTFYAAIVIWNHGSSGNTKNIKTAYSQTEPIDGDTTGYFRLTPSSGGPIADGGMGQTLELYDIVDVYLFLTPNPGETNWESMTKYSAYFDENCTPYRRFVVGYEWKTIKVTFVCADLSADTAQIASGVWYVRDEDGNVYKATTRITAIYGTVSVRTASNSTYSAFNVFLRGTGVGQKSDGTSFSVSSTPAVTIYTETGGDFSTSKTVTLNGAGDMSFTAYSSQDDAENETNGTAMTGCPIYDEIVVNNADADNLGTIANRSVNVQCNAQATASWTSIVMYCPDISNIAYKG